MTNINSLPTIFLTVNLFSASAFATDIKSETFIVESKTDYSGELPKMFFEPEVIEIHVGDTIKWINTSEEYHNVAFPTDPNGNSSKETSIDLFKKGDSWSYTFTKEGVFDYTCKPHVIFKMKGKVIVKPLRVHHRKVSLFRNS